MFDCSIANRALSSTTIAGALRTQADAEGRMSIFLDKPVLHGQGRGSTVIDFSLDEGGEGGTGQSKNRIISLSMSTIPFLTLPHSRLSFDFPSNSYYCAVRCTPTTCLSRSPDALLF